jgi:hypothetical protein
VAAALTTPEAGASVLEIKAYEAPLDSSVPGLHGLDQFVEGLMGPEYTPSRREAASHHPHVLVFQSEEARTS